MVWTEPKERGKGLAKGLILNFLNLNNNDVKLEVNKDNPAINIYEDLNFKIINMDKKIVTMCFKKRLSIMQPYIFPYIGYFHLLESSHKIIFYDDVNYIKRGWINRNRILLNKKEFLFTIPLEKVSQNKLINEIYPIIDDRFITKFLIQIYNAYNKAPFYNDVKELIVSVFQSNYENIAELAVNSILAVYDYLNISLNWSFSSICAPESVHLQKGDRLIQITKDLGYSKYVNSIGGKLLYDKDYFIDQGIELSFVHSNSISYPQFNNTFEPNLSIIDVLMFNDKKMVLRFFKNYNLI